MRLPPLTTGHIIRRYKRFRADVELEDGRIVTAHCPNTGAMTSCWAPGAPVQVSHNDNPKRKLVWTLERVDMGHGWVGVHTGRVNAVVEEGIMQNRFPTLRHYQLIKREPAFCPAQHPPSRFDLFLSGGTSRDAYVEIKNTTLLLDDDTIRFPDAVTLRGQKHLKLLVEVVSRGYRGVIVFAINRPEGRAFAPAWDIDPAYGDTLEWAANHGVEVMIARLRHHDTGIYVVGVVKVDS